MIRGYSGTNIDKPGLAPHAQQALSLGVEVDCGATASLDGKSSIHVTEWPTTYTKQRHPLMFPVKRRMRKTANNPA